MLKGDKKKLERTSTSQINKSTGIFRQWHIIFKNLCVHRDTSKKKKKKKKKGKEKKEKPHLPPLEVTFYYVKSLSELFS